MSHFATKKLAIGVLPVVHNGITCRLQTTFSSLSFLGHQDIIVDIIVILSLLVPAQSRDLFELTTLTNIIYSYINIYSASLHLQHCPCGEDRLATLPSNIIEDD